MLWRFFLKYLALPPASNFILIIVGAVVLVFKPKIGRGLIVLSLVSLYLFCTPFFASRLAHWWEDRYIAIRGQELAADYPKMNAQNTALVLLSAGQHPNAIEYGGVSLNSSSIVRTRYAAQLATSTQLNLLVTGGTIFDEEEGVANLMGRVLKAEYDVQPTWLENKATTTWENATYTQEMLHQFGISRVVLITEAWHMPRAVWSFEQAGLQVIPAPTYFYRDSATRTAFPLLPQANMLAYTARIFHEVLGLTWYRWQYEE